MAYRPNTTFNVPAKLLIPVWKTVNGVKYKKYPDPKDVPEDLVFFCAFRTFGGTETAQNGVYGIENTAIIETWYRPETKADCAICLTDSGEIYEILGQPENIEMRNQFLKFKVKRVGGKA